MIIIENTVGKSNADILKAISGDLDFIEKSVVDTNDVTVWIHKEKEGREVILNTNDHPLLPGHLSFSDYEEGGIELNVFLLCPDVTMENIGIELGL